MKRLFLILVLLVAVLAPVATPVAATDHQVSADDCIQHERHGERTAIDGDGPVVTISRIANDTTIRYTFNETRYDLAFSLPVGSLVINSTGFEIDETGVERKYNAQNPTLTLHYTAPVEGISYTATEDHFVFPLPYSESTTLQFRSNETGYIGARFALLGEYEVATAEAGCQQIQVVAPTAVAVDVDRYARVLSEASGDLDIGPRYKVVTAFVAPQDTGKRDGYVPEAMGEGTHGAAELFISPGSKIESPRNTLVHEYVHTRQAALRPKWVSEGLATYFTVALGVENGWISTWEADAFYAADAGSDRTVADHVDDSMVPYVRGAFFFDSLSKELAGTNASVETVYREINVQGYRESLQGRIGTQVTEKRLISVAEDQSGMSVAPENRVQYENPAWFVVLIGLIIRESAVAAFLTVFLGVAALKWLVLGGSGDEEGEEN